MPNTPLSLTTVLGVPYGVASARLLHMAYGAWLCDVEISANDLIALPMPSGKVTLSLAGGPLVGTVDPQNSGAWGPTGRVRVVAGGGGWAKSVLAQQWHSDGGILSSVVYTATGALVGETVIDTLPTVFPADFVRAGAPAPASAVFRDTPWWLDIAGITHTGPRLPGIPDPTLVIRDYEPNAGRVTFSCEGLLVPGTPLVDPRFGGKVPVAGDVEQIFDGQGSIGWTWVNSAAGVSNLVGDLKAATLAWTRAPMLRAYRYRLVQYLGPGPGGPPVRMGLQAVTPAAGIPDMLPLSPWSGVAGIEAQLAPSQEVLVVFENADPTLPRVSVYSLVGKPLKITLDASVELDIGPTVPVVNVGALGLVNLAGGATFLVPAPWAAALQSALDTFGATLTALTPATDPASTMANVNAIAAAGKTLGIALGTLPPDATTKTKGT